MNLGNLSSAEHEKLEQFSRDLALALKRVLGDTNQNPPPQTLASPNTQEKNHDKSSPKP